MLKRFLICLGMGFLLAGCVLQSHQPLFAESDGAMLPENLGTTFVMENLDKDMWNKEEGTLTLRPVGQHYMATDEKKKDEITAMFIPLDKNWWVMQAQAKDQSSVYILAEYDGDALLLRPLLCDNLKKQPAAAAEISFESDDCYLKGGEGIAYFKSLVASADPAKMRMVKAN